MNKEQINSKAAALEAAIRQIEKNFGEGSIMRFGQKQDMEVISTGSLALDIALGVGGFPCGRIIEIYGPEASGKTTIALHAIAEAQKKGGICAFIDTEHAFDPTYASQIGVNIFSPHWFVSQPTTAEEALEIVDTLVRSQAVSLVVLDSVAALVPKAEIEGEMGDSHMGLQARLMSQALRKLTGTISKSGSVVIFINQIRQKIGVMFGNPETTTGGNALKFYASVRLDIRRVTTLKKGDDSYGNQTRAKVVKNKVAPPFKTVEFEVHYGHGICRMSEIIGLGTKFDLIKKSGSWYSIDGVKIGQGQDAVKKHLQANPELVESLELKIRQLGMSNNAALDINDKTEDEVIEVPGNSTTQKNNEIDHEL